MNNKNIIFHTIAILIFISLKFAFIYAATSNLNFILQPTNKLVEWLTGTQSIFVSETGYYYKQLNVVIDKSCSGYNFWLLCFLMLSFLSLKYFGRITDKILVFVASLFVSFILTIVVNSSRIYTSIIVQRLNFPLLQIKPAITHETIGIITNLMFLILIYLTTEKILTNIHPNEEPA